MTVGLEINLNKTKAMIQSRKHQLQNNNIIIDGDVIEIADQCIYLGSSFQNNEDESGEMRRGIGCANRAYYSLHSAFKCSIVHRTTKIRIHKAIIRLTLIYGCESWTLIKKDVNALKYPETHFGSNK
ncbi:hypothetical protein C0J52_22134 [Blattella germanica]|nr:hypothetical protein C0J52_22134 [Blattella germanica]